MSRILFTEALTTWPVLAYCCGVMLVANRRLRRELAQRPPYKCRWCDSVDNAPGCSECGGHGVYGVRECDCAGTEGS